MGPARWLGFYAERFATVESNSAFYRLPAKSTFENWRAKVPPDFVFALKVSRYLTHVRRLQDPAEPVKRFLERSSGLGSKLGPVLLQLPPSLRCDPALLAATLRAFGNKVRVAVEPRHESWFVEEVRRVLEDCNAALCVAQGGRIDSPIWRTTDWAYVRFHAGKGRPSPCYTRAQLDAQARALLNEWDASSRLFCFFNNDEHGCALRDARIFSDVCRQKGLETTRVPPPVETRVGQLKLRG